MRFRKHDRRDTTDDEIRDAESRARESSEEQVTNLPPPPLVTVGGLSDERPEDDASVRSDA